MKVARGYNLICELFGYARVSMLSKFKCAGVNTEELLHNYKQFVRVMLEYCSVAWHSSLSTAVTLQKLFYKLTFLDD